MVYPESVPNVKKTEKVKKHKHLLPLLGFLELLMLSLGQLVSASAGTLPGFTSSDYGANSYPEGLPPEIAKNPRIVPPDTILKAIALGAFQSARATCAFNKDTTNRGIYVQRLYNYIQNMKISLSRESYGADVDGILSEKNVRQFVGTEISNDYNTKRFANSLGNYLDKNTCMIKEDRRKSFKQFFIGCYANYLVPNPEDDKILPRRLMSHNKWCSVHESGESFKNYIHLFDQ